VAFTTTESIRVKVGDRPRFNREEAEGDGLRQEFELQYRPVVETPAPSVWKNDVLLVENTGYTVDYDNGIVSFTSVPVTDDKLVFQYTSVVWSDLEIEDFYAGADNSTTLASARILYAWAARLAVDATKESRSGGGGLGAITVDTSVRSREMRATADSLMKQYDQFEGVGEPVEGITEVAWNTATAERMIRNHLIEWDS
jgi:hypothetical protein